MHNVAENGNDSVVFFLHVIKVTGEQCLSLQSQHMYMCRTEKVDFQIIEPRCSFISGQKVEENWKLGEAFSNVFWSGGKSSAEVKPGMLRTVNEYYQLVFSIFFVTVFQQSEQCTTPYLLPRIKLPAYSRDTSL